VRTPVGDRQLPFDSVEPFLLAAGVDLAAWRGLRVLEDDLGGALCNNAPKGEQLPDEVASHRHREHYSHLVLRVM
jgi:hypothetical protein